MEKRILGGSLEVSAIGLGCMGLSHAYGEPVEEEEAVRTIRYAQSIGYSFFDTAEVYVGTFADGRMSINEHLIGRALAPVRHSVQIATKFGIRINADRSLTPDGRPEAIRASGSPARQKSAARSASGTVRGPAASTVTVKHRRSGRFSAQSSASPSLAAWDIPSMYSRLAWVVDTPSRAANSFCRAACFTSPHVTGVRLLSEYRRPLCGAGGRVYARLTPLDSPSPHRAMQRQLLKPAPNRARPLNTLASVLGSMSLRTLRGRRSTQGRHS